MGANNPKGWEEVEFDLLKEKYIDWVLNEADSVQLFELAQEHLNRSIPDWEVLSALVRNNAPHLLKEIKEEARLLKEIKEELENDS